MENMAESFLFLLFAGLSCLVFVQCSAPEQQLTAYEVLESYGFPVGLLPPLVKDYTLDSNGRFVVVLDGTCSVDIPTAYPVKYASRITGRISYGRLQDLNGITVKIFLLWWNIDAISVSGTDLVFQVGIFSDSYPISNFVEPPDCKRRVEERSFALQ